MLETQRNAIQNKTERNVYELSQCNLNPNLKVTVGNDQKWRSQKEISTPNTEVGKHQINNQVRILRKHKQLFPH